MPKKPKKGYFVHGQFVAEGSELDLEFQRELRGDTPSKTELKRESAALQALGESLLSLRESLFNALALSDKLRDAITDARRIRDFEGRRRQMQYIGKLMRTLDPETIAAIRHAIDEQTHGPAGETAALHAAEHWRDRLIADDNALGDWIESHPATDAQQLRALVRQARKDMKPGAPGAAVRQGRAYREIFQLVRAQLAAHRTGGHAAATEQHPEENTHEP